MPTPPDAAEPPPPEERKADRLVADLHLAEYRAVRTELAHWITLQYATYSVAFIFLGVAVRFQNSAQVAEVIWAVTVGLLLLGWAWLQTACEIACHALYIEEILKPRVRKLIRDNSVWKWEEYLQSQRQKGLVWFEWRFGLIIPFVSALGVLAFFIYQKVSRPWGLGDYLWAGLAVYISFLLLVKARQTNELAHKLGVVTEARP